jgi:hypothetical protein
MNSLAHNLNSVEEREEAADIFRQIVQTRKRVFGDSDRYLPDAMRSLAWVLVLQEQCEEASPIALEAVDRARSSYGEGASVTRTAIYVAAAALRGQGDYTRSEEMHRALLNLGVDQNIVGEAMILQEIAYVKLMAEKFEDAASLFEQALAIQRDANASSDRIRGILIGIGRARTICSATRRRSRRSWKPMNSRPRAKTRAARSSGNW